MHRLWEIILGLEKGFLSQEGELSLQFSPRWPLQEVIGAGVWNVLLAGLVVGLVVYVYRRETRSASFRLVLGFLRLALFGFVIAMLNRPTFSVAQSQTESSVLAIMLDDSQSMTVGDAGAGRDGQGQSRFDAMLELVGGQNRRLLRDLAEKHVVKVYSFDSDARSLGSIVNTPAGKVDANTDVLPALNDLKPVGKSTQVLACLRHVLEDLQGQRLAGVVVCTDGRNAPAESVAEALSAVRGFGVRVYPVAVGSEQAPRNVVVEDVDMEPSAFLQDIVSAKVRLRTTGFPAGHRLTVVLKDKATGLPLIRADGQPAQTTIALESVDSQVVEVVFKPGKIQTLDVVAEVVKQPGQISQDDNTLTRQIAILDSRISVLYCDGYPRWDYRYLKTALIRDQTIDVSCLLLSADRAFSQEGDPASKTFPGPITRFPQTMSELLAYDVVLFGDVDPRQLTDAQLQLVSDFVLKKNGGFGMIAGPRWSPVAYRNTPIEALLPVSIARMQPNASDGDMAAGWRPALTRVGAASSIFRFFEDPTRNRKFIEEGLEPLFWYCRGITAKPNVAQVYAEHPTDNGPDGKKAPLLVLGRLGGRTLFSAIDDSWRWRFYTGESVFNTYWVQQIRYLARERKLGQRRLTLTALRPAYELGQVVEAHLRVLDPELLNQLSDRINLSVMAQSADGAEQLVGQQTLRRRENDPELFVASWTADQVGQFSLRLPVLAGNTQPLSAPVAVKSPSLELLQPQVDRDLLSKLSQGDSADAKGNGIDASRLVLNGQASIPTLRQELAKIPSAGLTQLVYTNHLLWNAPLAMVIFLGLITAEWVTRKVFGML